MAGRPSGPKTRCSGKWSEARYKSFIKGALRQATMKWAPIQECLANARTRRGFYRCNVCKQEVPATVKVGRKRVKNILVDHINPIISPEQGWISWDDTIERMFCELDNLQAICKPCHDIKCQEEKEVAKKRRAQEKANA